MLTIKSYLGISPIHGVGCFAAQDIAAGDLVWQLDPGLDACIPEENLANYSPAVIDFLKIYTYGQIENRRRFYILCGDHARHMNHSNDPNVIEASDGSARNYAARAIAAGEELTCDYFAFDSDARAKLGLAG